MRGEIRLDLVVYRLSQSYDEWVLERQLKKGTMPLTESGGYGVPRDMVLPVSKINFLGSKMGCPSQPDAYLRVLYGDYDKPPILVRSHYQIATTTTHSHYHRSMYFVTTATHSLPNCHYRDEFSL